MRSDRGAITIHVAIALMALILFSGMVIDFGAMWVSRAQAQNAADAGALAAAIALQLKPTDHAGAAIAGRTLAGDATNSVWGEATAASNIDVDEPVCPDGTNSCIRVDVLRGIVGRSGATHSNAIPTFIMRMLPGLSTQGVRATATAQVASGNSVTCAKPWAVADKWTDNSATGSNHSGWDQEDVFNPGVDVYTPGQGFVPTGTPNDYGTELVLKGDQEFAAAWSMIVELGGGNGSAAYRNEIRSCPSYVPTIGLYDGTPPCNSRSDTNPETGCINVRTGVRAGPTSQGVSDLVGLDSGATWNAGSQTVTGGCMASGSCTDSDGNPVTISPRIVPIALFNPQAYFNSGCHGNNCVVQVTNIIGFFVEGQCSDIPAASRPTFCDPSDVIGRIINHPALFKGVAGAPANSSFLKIVRLVR